MMERQDLMTRREWIVAEPLGWEAQHLVRLGEDLGWEPQVLGFAPPPEAPIYLGDWMITPPHLDSSPLPARAWMRIQAIHAAGLRPQYVLVHETPRLLAAPQPQPRWTWADVHLRLAEAGTALHAFGAKAAPVAWQVTKALAIAAGTAAVVSTAGMALLLGLAVAAAAVDPVLIAITEADHCWIEVDRWDMG